MSNAAELMRGELLTEHGWLTETEAAIVLSLPLQTLIQYRKRGVGPPHSLIGRRIVYQRSTLAAWLARGGTREAE